MEVSGIEGNFRFTCKNVMRVLREHRPSVMAMLEAFVYDPLINWRLLESTAVKAMPASIVEGSLIVGAAAGVAADAPSGLQSEDLSMQRPTHHRSVFQAFFFTNCSVLLFLILCLRDEREIGKLIAIGEEGDGALSEVRNSRAVTITKRVQDKLTGRDFENEADPLDIDSQAPLTLHPILRHILTYELQVARLISEAISEANLSQVRFLQRILFWGLLMVYLTLRLQCYIGWCPFW
jgi:FKBP12-rapamycin complex-associated protein